MHPSIAEIREIQALRLENTKLRTQLADVAESMGRVEERCAKLRELVLARFACDSDAYESCADCQLSGSKPFRCVEVARELCVEVD